MRSIRIAGAGPAGLSAAIHLAREGLPVEVFERREAVGARFIGEWQVLESYSREQDALEELASMGIETTFHHVPATWAHLIDDRGNRHEVQSAAPYGYFLRRGDEEGTLDRMLAAQAERAGVKIRLGAKLDPTEADVVATGPGPADGIAKEIAFRTDGADRIEVIFDPDLAPGGYAYLFVIDGWATLGLALLKSYGKLEAHFERTVARFSDIAPFEIREPRRGYSYMNFFLHGSSQADGARFAGEAGGFQDYLFGLGIRYALVSGHLAARSILENVSYDELWRDRFLDQMRSSVGARLLYESLGRFGLRTFVGRSSRSDFRAYLHSWARPARWRLWLAPLAERVFGRAESCAHKLPCHWCRPREGRSGAPEPLPADFVARYLREP
ncbi:MAG TPA: NAD(P)/FAD-dependent oxidoreductase [Vicinamibacteria bacterium]|nr:NAD(P)/FAD-dependent oxidoreductase [Vicinamibacteria bacterium]